jgi:hypothetical protein
MNPSTPPEWQLSRRWPDPDTGEFVVTIELGKVPDALGEGWHLDAIRICLSSETRAITTTVLRQVHAWSLVREVIKTQVNPHFELERNAPSLSYMSFNSDGSLRGPMTPDEIANTEGSRDAAYDEAGMRLRLNEATERRTGRPRSVTPDFLREVAAVWLAANDHGEPRAAVAHHFGDVPPSTAGRWITKARDAGLLPPSGRARKQEETKS